MRVEGETWVAMKWTTKHTQMLSGRPTLGAGGGNITGRPTLDADVGFRVSGFGSNVGRDEVDDEAHADAHARDVERVHQRRPPVHGDLRARRSWCGGAGVRGFGAGFRV